MQNHIFIFFANEGSALNWIKASKWTDDLPVHRLNREAVNQLRSFNQVASIRAKVCFADRISDRLTDRRNKRRMQRMLTAGCGSADVGYMPAMPIRLADISAVCWNEQPNVLPKEAERSLSSLIFYRYCAVVRICCFTYAVYCWPFASAVPV